MASKPTWCAFISDDERGYGVTSTVLGVTRSWGDLCIQFHRHGSPCPTRNPIHFRTVNRFDPKLFAVCLDTLQVFYHRNDQWHLYQSARDVRLGTLEELQVFFNNNSNNDEDDDEDFSQDDNDGQDRDDQHGQQTKDSTSHHHSDYLMDNHSIIRYRLIRLLLFFQILFCHRQHQSLILDRQALLLL